MNLAEREEAEAVTFTHTETVMEKGSSFIARAVKTGSINDVRAMYESLLTNPINLSATHNIAGYRLQPPNSTTVTDGFNDDDDFGMGRVVRDEMQKQGDMNMVIFITRQYGGIHLGNRRFEIIKDLVKKVLEKHKETNKNTTT